MTDKNNSGSLYEQSRTSWMGHGAAVLTGIFVVAGIGCSPDGLSVQAFSRQAAGEAAGESPTELLELVRDKLTSAAATAQMLTSTSGGFRLQMLRAHIDDGVRFADAVLSHEDATGEQVNEATLARLRLLDYGVQRSWPGFQGKLDEFLQELKQNHDSDTAAEAAEAFSLRQRLRDAGLPTAETFAALDQHIEKYPHSEITLNLLIDYGDDLLARSAPDAAIACYQQARALGDDHPGSASVADRLKKAQLRKADLAKAKRRQRAQRQHEASYLDDIRSQIGFGRDNSIFVVGAEKQTSKHLIPVNYQIFRGARDVAAYVKSLKKDWKWEVLGVYPNTKLGYQRAMERHRELMKDTISF